MASATQSVQQAYQELIALLAPNWGFGEARATARALFEDAFDFPRPSDTSTLLTGDQALRLKDFTRRLLEHDEPLAYLTGIAHFAGMKLAVSPAVLIPRPETEEWVHRVIQDWRAIAGENGHNPPANTPIRVLEVGTGSGCIALALANALPGFSVTALDISAEALTLASSNASRLGVSINFLQGDFLAPAFRRQLPVFDLLISNPPYIDPREMPDLDTRVRDHEPHLALFGPPQDPLAFYSALADFAQTHLLLSGRSQSSLGLPIAYLETSALSAAAALQRWESAGLQGRLEKDLSGRDRLLLGWAKT